MGNLGTAPGRPISHFERKVKQNFLGDLRQKWWKLPPGLARLEAGTDGIARLGTKNHARTAWK
jgi:hypothetical protein